MFALQRILVLLFAVCVVAAPTATLKGGNQKRSSDSVSWTPALEAFYNALGKRLAQAPTAPTAPNPPSCDLSKAVMPSAPTPLPAPNSGLVLSHVTIGRGTQNYTCASPDASATPVPVGANATLFNASCIAANYPDLLTLLPAVALQYPIPETSIPNSAANLDLIGWHYFLNLTTPYIDLNIPNGPQNGAGIFKKNGTSPAPAGTQQDLWDKATSGEANGDVAWLELQPKTSDQTLQQIFRLNTAGGSPPANCAGQPENIYVQYAAEYWIFTAAPDS